MNKAVKQPAVQAPVAETPKIRVSAIVKEIYEDVHTKTKADGTPGNDYIRVKVKFTEGALNGKTWFANRTLGENRVQLTVGQEVICYGRNVVGDDGVTRAFFDISASTVTPVEDILAAMG